MDRSLAKAAGVRPTRSRRNETAVVPPPPPSSEGNSFIVNSERAREGYFGCKCFSGPNRFVSRKMKKESGVLFLRSLQDTTMTDPPTKLWKEAFSMVQRGMEHFFWTSNRDGTCIFWVVLGGQSGHTLVAFWFGETVMTTNRNETEIGRSGAPASPSIPLIVMVRSTLGSVSSCPVRGGIIIDDANENRSQFPVAPFVLVVANTPHFLRLGQTRASYVLSYETKILQVFVALIGRSASPHCFYCCCWPFSFFS